MSSNLTNFGLVLFGLSVIIRSRDKSISREKKTPENSIIQKCLVQWVDSNVKPFANSFCDRKTQKNEIKNELNQQQKVRFLAKKKNRNS